MFNIRELRKHKAWSQARLAETAGLSVRTIQRIEQTGQASDESLLAIAQALDVDVQLLSSKPDYANKGDSVTMPKLLFRPIDRQMARNGGVLFLLPALLFIVCNVLEHELNMPGSSDFFVRTGEALGLAPLFPIFTSPVLLLGGPAIAILLAVFSQLRVQGRRTTNGIEIDRVGLQIDMPLLLALGGSMLAILALLGYAAVENVSEWILEILETV